MRNITRRRLFERLGQVTAAVGLSAVSFDPALAGPQPNINNASSSKRPFMRRLPRTPA